jgi:ABC-2 type transport system ATP-binding protein
MPAILEVQGLEKKFGDFRAVKSISFEVEEGEVFGLLGPNGAGKTTAISMLTGVLPPTAGTARIGGYDILEQSDDVKRINGLERVEDVLRVVALVDRADEAVEKYSGGMKRRVNIAAGLVHQPQLLFLDEPTVGVDPQSRNHIFESVMRLNREREMSIVYTSHYMEEVELLCNRVAIMDQGEIIAMDTIKNLIALLGGGVIQVGVDKADDGLVEAIAALPSVKEASLVASPAAPPLADDQLGDEVETAAPEATPVIKVVAEHSQQAVVNVIRHLNESYVVLTSLEILEPNLESVFLHLTGKKLRE